ncbi:hypothetical protein CEXT_556481 [Caerostris extrusa]|uniref:Uncharacterized protein n=1 Tax=Caerostris extrusa TaxID=172846 RepID=A0AAV4MMF7_CAEEX|nr:hypothetical protein CEXT_556481 [Caerostris extrusa]
MKQHGEVKNLVNKTSNALAKQKCSAVSFSKKKISAAKNFLQQQQNKESSKSPLKKLEFSNKNAAQFDNKKNHYNSYSHNILALYDVDRLNRNQSPSSLSYKITSNKKNISKQEDSSWVPMKTKKNNSPKDASFEKKDALDRKRNSLSKGCSKTMKNMLFLLNIIQKLKRRCTPIKQVHL